MQKHINNQILIFHIFIICLIWLFQVQEKASFDFRGYFELFSSGVNFTFKSVAEFLTLIISTFTSNIGKSHFFGYAIYDLIMLTTTIYFANKYIKTCRYLVLSLTFLLSYSIIGLSWYTRQTVALWVLLNLFAVSPKLFVNKIGFITSVHFYTGFFTMLMWLGSKVHNIIHYLAIVSLLLIITDMKLLPSITEVFDSRIPILGWYTIAIDSAPIKRVTYEAVIYFILWSIIYKSSKSNIFFSGAGLVLILEYVLMPFGEGLNRISFYFDGLVIGALMIIIKDEKYDCKIYLLCLLVILHGLWKGLQALTGGIII